jgi:hypothetical protein
MYSGKKFKSGKAITPGLCYASAAVSDVQEAFILEV